MWKWEIDLDEECDDKNLISFDGCSSVSLVEKGFYCSEEGICTTLCGDGIIAGKEVCDPGKIRACTDDCLVLNDTSTFYCYVKSIEESFCWELSQSVYWTSTTSASVAGVSTASLVLPAAATASLGPSVWINVNTIQVIWTTSLFGSKQNQYSQNCLNANYHPFSINYAFTKSVSNYFYSNEDD